MSKISDIDIDVANREKILAILKHHPAKLVNGSKHNTGVYFTNIPSMAGNTAAIDYKTAEQLGYYKIDLLNIKIYERVKNEVHLIELMNREPDWNRLWEDADFCQQIIHIGNYYDLICKMRPDSIERMAMFLAILRPGKAHLKNLSWEEIAKTVWIPPADDKSYHFKKSHSIGYSHLVVVHMNLIRDEEERKLKRIADDELSAKLLEEAREENRRS